MGDRSPKDKQKRKKQHDHKHQQQQEQRHNNNNVSRFPTTQTQNPGNEMHTNEPKDNNRKAS